MVSFSLLQEVIDEYVDGSGIITTKSLLFNIPNMMNGIIPVKLEHEQAIYFFKIPAKVALYRTKITNITNILTHYVKNRIVPQSNQPIELQIRNSLIIRARQNHIILHLLNYFGESLFIASAYVPCFGYICSHSWISLCQSARTILLLRLFKEAFCLPG